MFQLVERSLDRTHRTHRTHSSLAGNQSKSSRLYMAGTVLQLLLMVMVAAGRLAVVDVHASGRGR
jgi:hypothetical protein